MKNKKLALCLLGCTLLGSTVSMFFAGGHVYRMYYPDLNSLQEIRESKLSPADKEYAVYTLASQQCFAKVKSKMPKGSSILKDDGFERHDVTGTPVVIASQARVYDEKSGGLLKYICQYTNEKDISIVYKVEGYSGQ